MIRIAALLFALYVVDLAHAQAPANTAAPASSAKSSAKISAKQPKAKAAAKQAGPSETGPCGIGVIPVIGDQFVVQRVGFTVFGNERAETSIAGWNLDDLIVARVRAAAGPGVAVRRITYPKGTFADYLDKPASLFSSPAIKFGDLVRQVAGSANCGRYVVVTRTSNRFGSSNQTVEGVGIVGVGGTIVVKPFTSVFALTGIQIFDGRDFSVIKQERATISDQPAVLRGLTERIVGPSREVDETAFPRSPSDVVNSPVLRDGVRAVLAESLDKTLPALLAR